jgi:hypothetical protein
MDTDIRVFLEHVSKICRQNFKLHEDQRRTEGTLHDDQYTFLIIAGSFLFKMRNLSDKTCREIKTRNNFFPDIMPFKRYCGKQMYSRASQMNSAHAQCMLYTYVYRHTLRICNTYCFSTATMVARTRLSVKRILPALFGIQMYQDTKPTSQYCDGCMLNASGSCWR